jgi:hypothetical protein
MIHYEVFLPIKDYFNTLEGRDVSWDFGIPAVASVAVVLLVFSLDIATETLKAIGSSYMSFGAVLMGFAIACFTIFATSSNPNVEEIRLRKTDKKTRGQKMTLYQEILAGFMFIILLSTSGLLLSFILFLGSMFFIPPYKGLLILLGGTTLLFLSSIFLIVRNMTNFYHILWKKPDLKKEENNTI